MKISKKDWYTDVVIPMRIRDSIRHYLSLDSVIDSIKVYSLWGISKQQLQEILNGEEFLRYKNNKRYKDLIIRCNKEDLT